MPDEIKFSLEKIAKHMASIDRELGELIEGTTEAAKQYSRIADTYEKLIKQDAKDNGYREPFATEENPDE